MAVPVGTTAVRVRASGEPWDRVGLRPAPGHDLGTHAGCSDTQKQQGREWSRGGKWQKCLLPEPGLPGRFRKPCLEVSRSQKPKGALQARPSPLPALLSSYKVRSAPSPAQQRRPPGNGSPHVETHQAPLAACSPCCPTGFS